MGGLQPKLLLDTSNWDATGRAVTLWSEMMSCMGGSEKSLACLIVAERANVTSKLNLDCVWWCRKWMAVLKIDKWTFSLATFHLSSGWFQTLVQMESSRVTTVCRTLSLGH